MRSHVLDDAPKTVSGESHNTECGQITKTVSQGNKVQSQAPGWQL